VKGEVEVALVVTGVDLRLLRELLAVERVVGQPLGEGKGRALPRLVIEPAVDGRGSGDAPELEARSVLGGGGDGGQGGEKTGDDQAGAAGSWFERIRRLVRSRN